MVTKTASKRLSLSRPRKVTIKKADRDDLAECLGFDVAFETERVNAAIKFIETQLSRAKARLLALPTIPLPAHKASEFRAIATAADAFALTLQLSRVHPSIWRELSLDTNVLTQVREQAEDVRDAASRAAARLSKKNHRGDSLSFFKDSLDKTFVALRFAFDAHYVDGLDSESRASDLQEFLKICRRYLPLSPNKKPKAKRE